MKEQALLLGSQHSLVGVYTPADNEKNSGKKHCAFIFLNAGLTHHVGPHRLHVKLARELSSRGFCSLRIDLSGIGDSSVSPENMPANELALNELSQLMDDLKHYGHTDFIIFGICSGAKLGLQIAQRDTRVKGLILVNQAIAPSDPMLEAQISADFYLKKSMWDPKAWLNLISGRVDYKKLWKALTSILKTKSPGDKNKKINLSVMFHDELAPALTGNIKLLVLLSDRHAKFIDMHNNKIQSLQKDKRLQINVFPQADHLFTLLEEQKTLIEQITEWSRLFKQA